MTGTDEMDRLARANPVPPGSVPATTAPSPPRDAGSRRPRRVIGPIVAAIGTLSLVSVIAALIVATPDDGNPPATFDGTLRVSLLDRPQVDADRVGIAPIPPTMDPATLRRVADGAFVTWLAARPTAHAAEACLLRLGQDDALRVVTCRRISDGLVASVDRDELGWRVIGLVPDAIGSVSIGDVSAPVRENVFELSGSGTPPEHAILEGPAASAIPPAAGIAILTREGSPPAVAVSLADDPPPAPRGGLGSPPPVPANPVVRGTLAQAVVAMPFTILVPDPPPLSGRLEVSWSRDHPDLFPQATLVYLPETTGAGVSLLEGPRRGTPGARGGERTIRRGGREFYVFDGGRPAGPVTVRVVMAGTDVQISGLPLDGLVAVAESLRPQRP